MRKKVLFPALLLGLTAPLCFSQQFSGVSAEFIGDYSKKPNILWEEETMKKILLFLSIGLTHFPPL